jgi:hypothetical protein
VLRNRQDAEGAFLRKTLGDGFFPTSSGYMACITAGGINLEHGRRPEVALETFRKLPKSQRLPGVVKVGRLDPVDAKVAPPLPPSGGIILKVYARLMRRKADGSLDYVSTADFPLMAGYDQRRIDRNGYLFEASADHVWITDDEWRSLVSDGLKPGQRVDVPDAVTRRICRFHLVPQRIYGEGGEWHPKSVRSAALTLTVQSATAEDICFRIDGHARLGSAYDASTATTPNGKLKRGYASTFHGRATYDLATRRFTRVEMISLGDTWGRMGDANRKSVAVERPGRHPLVFAFELVSGERPVDCLVPMGRVRKLAGFRYLQTER